MVIKVVSNSETVSKEHVYSQIMFEIQKRMVDIELNRDQSRPIDQEIADMMHLTTKLSEIECVDSLVIEERKRLLNKQFEA